MSSTSPSSGPLILQNVTTEASTWYDMHVEIMLTDLNSASEYTDISINGVNVGQCNPSSCQGCCTWYNCTISPSRFYSASTFLTVQLQYSYAVNDFAVCSYNGYTGHAVARVTLTAGNVMILLSSCIRDI